MRAESILHPLGRLTTRVLLHPTVRRLPGVTGLYSVLYRSGKQLAEQAECRFLASRITPGDTIIDIGANLGFYTSLFAKSAGETGRVYAFEPDPLMFAILKKRTSKSSSVTAECLGLSDHSGEAVLYCSRANRADNRIAPSHTEPTEQVTIKLETFDSFARYQNITRIDGVKMDVQGAEIAVLRGMRDVMKKMPPRWILLEFSPEHLRGAKENPADLWQLLAQYRYTPFLLEHGSLLSIADVLKLEQQASSFTNIFAMRE